MIDRSHGVTLNGEQKASVQVEATCRITNGLSVHNMAQYFALLPILVELLQSMLALYLYAH